MDIKWKGSVADLVRTVAGSDARATYIDSKTGAKTRINIDGLEGATEPFYIEHGDQLYDAYNRRDAARILSNIRRGKKFPDANPGKRKGGAGMDFETAISKARAWAERNRHRSVDPFAAAVEANAAYDYISAMDANRLMGEHIGIGAGEADAVQLSYVINNLRTWRGPEAREAKKAILARIKRARNPSVPWHESRQRELEGIKKFWLKTGMSPSSPVYQQTIGREREESLAAVVGKNFPMHNPRKKKQSSSSPPKQGGRAVVLGLLALAVWLGWREYKKQDVTATESRKA